MLDARDPVCGMTVDITTSYSEALGGETYYFCSEQCRQRFDANPAGYGAGSRTATDSGLERHEPPHTTKGGITSPKFGSAGSGGAEYERLPEQHVDTNHRDDE
jgi:YHS domain-containing protein